MSTVGDKQDELVSHGRGGQGNISKDDVRYADGEIVREGTVGDQADGAYSSGRGGAGNVGSPGLKPTRPSQDAERVPDMAIHTVDPNEPHHTGRGGGGNVEKGPPKSSTRPEGLADKLKYKLLGKKSHS